MLSNPRWLVAAGGAVFLLGLGLYCGLTPAMMQSPPAGMARSSKTRVQEREKIPEVELLSAPWFRAPPVESAPVKKPVAAPPPPAPIDKASVVFLGSYKDQSGADAYFFKYQPTGQVMVLKVGQAAKGWTLKTISDTAFTLSGTGGLYEVAR
jgi:hypothetical protein